MNRYIDRIELVLRVDQGLPMIYDLAIREGGDPNLADARQVGIRRFDVDCSERYGQGLPHVYGLD
jgi:hypothetical protein